MITHNGTYLLHATHHGMPIYAATMGGKMVIGGKWLLPEATKQAIVAAFGSAEGTEVIRKTNDYLNRIATTDPQRALLLAGFINEDPMLVCSLVETSKTRWLVGDGQAAINSGVLMKAGIGVDTNIDILESGSVELWGTGNSNQYLTAWALSGNNWRYMKSPISLTLTIPTNGGVHIVQDASGLYINGEKKGSYNTSGTTSNSIWIFGKDTFAKCRIQYFYMRDDVVTIREMYPFIRNGENGMLDIISGTFYPNANTQGSFTIQITDKA